MRARFEEFALSLHTDKTRLIEFGRYAAADRERRGLGKLETFNFLGFTFICGRSRRGSFVLKRKSRRDLMRAKLKEIKEELWRQMHWPIPEQGSWLAQVIKGFFGYQAVPNNYAALGTLPRSIFTSSGSSTWPSTKPRSASPDFTALETPAALLMTREISILGCFS
jgi:RNA-directed DNA polymerase